VRGDAFSILMPLQHRTGRASFPLVLKSLCTTEGLKEPNGMKYVEAFSLLFNTLFYKVFICMNASFVDYLDK